MGEINDPPKEEPRLRPYRFYPLPIISCCIIIIANIIGVLNSHVTAFCLADSVTNTVSRTVEITSIILFAFCGFVLMFKKANLVVLFFTIVAIGLELATLLFIVRVNIGESCNYPSKIWAFFSIFITLGGAIINTGYLSINQIKVHPSLPKKTIMWYVGGGFLLLIAIFALCYWELRALTGHY